MTLLMNTELAARDGLRAFLSVGIAVLVSLSNSPAIAQVSPGDGQFPLAVQCSFAGTARYYYLSMIKPDGLAVYASPDGLAATITITGTATKIATEGNGSCTGKTIEELRDAGQALDIR